MKPHNMERVRFLVTGPTGFDPMGYRVHFGILRQDGTGAVAQPATMRAYDPNDPGSITAPSESLLRLDYDVAKPAFQELLDSLWQLGFRPSDIGTPGHLAATQAHLDDMQKLVSKAYGVDL